MAADSDLESPAGLADVPVSVGYQSGSHYTREVFDESREWVAAHGIFPDGNPGSGEYAQATIGILSLTPRYAHSNGHTGCQLFED